MLKAHCLKAIGVDPAGEPRLVTGGYVRKRQVKSHYTKPIGVLGKLLSTGKAVASCEAETPNHVAKSAAN